MKATTVISILALAALLPAQKSQEELKQAQADKLGKEVFTKAKWVTDYDAARAEAKKTGKLIFAYFTRSYAH